MMEIMEVISFKITVNKIIRNCFLTKFSSNCEIVELEIRISVPFIGTGS